MSGFKGAGERGDGSMTGTRRILTGAGKAETQAPLPGKARPRGQQQCGPPGRSDLDNWAGPAKPENDRVCHLRGGHGLGEKET